MIAKPLIFEPCAGKSWEAWGVHKKYVVRDNGLWDSDPDHSGPLVCDVLCAQAQEDLAVLSLLSEDVYKLVIGWEIERTKDNHENDH